MSNESFAESGKIPVNIRSKKELGKKETDAIANALAVSFKGYPLFEYFSNYKYSVSKMKAFWRVSLKTLPESSLVVSCGDGFESVALLIPNTKSYVSVWNYLKSGGLAVIFRLGITNVTRMLRFEKLAEEIKSKYATPKCQYLDAFVTLPELRGKGLGAKTLHSALDLFDEIGEDCYLETMSAVNVKIYEKHGFELKESVRIPDTDMTLYAMLRAHKPD